jgi:hypothetical protein
MPYVDEKIYKLKSSMYVHVSLNSQQWTFSLVRGFRSFPLPRDIVSIKVRLIFKLAVDKEVVLRTHYLYVTYIWVGQSKVK